MKNKKAARITAVISAVFGYLLAMGLCVFFALYMSAPAGWTFFYMLAAVPVFSLILLVVTRCTDCLEITASADSSMVYKNEEFLYRIKIRNKSILPVPVIIIKMQGGGAEEKPYSTAVYTKGTTEFSISFKAEIWGVEKIGIKEIRIGDFLNIISLPIYKDDGRYISTIKVFPDIPDVPSDSPLIRSAADTIRFSDECEDTKESDGFNFFGGMPGYTHRPYVPGDPVKRINWKLTSKRNEYMVRLDDEIEAMQQVIVLDSKGVSDRRTNERAVEGVLSIASSLFKLGFDSVVFFNTRHGFISHEISELGDISVLRTAFAEYEFEDTPALRLPIDEITEKNLSGIMLCTPCPDTALSADIASADDSGVSVTVVAASDNINIGAPYWHLKNDYTAELIS